MTFPWFKGTWIALGLFGAFSLVGCGGGGGDKTINLSRNAWQVIGLRNATGAQVTCPGSVTVGTGSGSTELSCDGSDYITFNSNGTFTGSGTSGGANGSWTLTDSRLVIVSTETDAETGEANRVIATYTVTDVSSGGTTKLRLTQESFLFNGVRDTSLDGTSTIITVVA